jgi:NAD-dependent SIR2 family protein deacetylase
LKIDFDIKTLKSNYLPKCINCEKICRPHVVLFGDSYYLYDRENYQYSNYRNFLKNIKSNSKVTIIEIGCGLAIPTVRRQSEKLAEKYNGSVIRINPRECNFPDYIKDEELKKHVSIPLGTIKLIF